ncbi:outer membrane autotransporter protein [Hoeflea marina]|uniref:Outer membrane autotransporter protein n=1 Tax=Hoeflea marina TaxID=274592 RepID=A0A317PND1_9HYPH|nr:ice-binding family protein [Hoeflea marina]PWW02063.1 outer membrane autotransporter protein [Hoeflea marina]
MSRLYTTSVVIATLAPLALANIAGAQELSSFGVLAGTTVTNTGATVINGNVGVSPNNAITGFDDPGGPGVVTAPYAIYLNDGVAIQAQSDLTTAYTTFMNRPATRDLTGQDLGGLTLSAGVYSFADEAELTGTLTLDAQGNPNAVFIITVDSSLTTASNSVVSLVNGAQGANVYFVVGASATLGTDTAFAGNIMALTSITLDTTATIICGSALARNGAVTLDTNTISVCIAQAAAIGDVTAGSDTNTAAVADVLDQASGAGGLPVDFAALIAFLSPTELQAALAQLSGQGATAVAPAGRQAMDSFLSRVFDRIDDTRAPTPPEQTPVEQPDTGPATVRVLGYGPLAPVTRAGDAVASFGGRPAAIRTPLWSVWATAYGGWSESDGNSAVGSYDRTINTHGLAAGVDFDVSPETMVGIALGIAHNEFDLSGGHGGGDSDILQASVYGRQDFGPAYVAGALAYSFNDVSTDRFVTIGGTGHYGANFNAHDFAARVETGYRFALTDAGSAGGSIGITPYAGLQVQSFRTPSYSETTISGSTDFALDYAARTSNSLHTELGARFDDTIALENGSVLTLRGKIAWAHDTSTDTFSQASFQAIPDSAFIVQGADGASNSLLLSAGAEMAFGNGVSILGKVDTALSTSSQAYEASARIRYTW